MASLKESSSSQPQQEPSYELGNRPEVEDLPFVFEGMAEAVATTRTQDHAVYTRALNRQNLTYQAHEEQEDWYEKFQTHPLSWDGGKDKRWNDPSRRHMPFSGWMNENYMTLPLEESIYTRDLHTIDQDKLNQMLQISVDQNWDENKWNSSISAEMTTRAFNDSDFRRAEDRVDVHSSSMHMHPGDLNHEATQREADISVAQIRDDVQQDMRAFFDANDHINSLHAEHEQYLENQKKWTDHVARQTGM